MIGKTSTKKIGKYWKMSVPLKHEFRPTVPSYGTYGRGSVSVEELDISYPWAKRSVGKGQQSGKLLQTWGILCLSVVPA